ncbi:MAG: esterase family protein, partial [Clostridia bacterium]|nr:esterase family protein [Clostridia bacterium]
YRYRTFIGEELPKICRSFFPGMGAKREDNYVSGNSMGGYGSLALALTYPENYGVCAPLSAAFDPTHLHNPEHPENTFFTDIFGPIDDFAGSVNDLFHMAEVRKNDGSPLPKLYIDCGQSDFLLHDNHRMRDCLTALGYDVTYREPDGAHTWGFWDREIQNVLTFIDAYRKEI